MIGWHVSFDLIRLMRLTAVSTDNILSSHQLAHMLYYQLAHIIHDRLAYVLCYRHVSWHTGVYYVYGCSVLQCDAVCCSVLQCDAVCCSVLQCDAVCCSVLQCAAVCCSVLQCAAVCCSVLQCVAVCCSVLHHTSVYYIYSIIISRQLRYNHIITWRIHNIIITSVGTNTTYTVSSSVSNTVHTYYHLCT